LTASFSVVLAGVLAVAAFLLAGLSAWRARGVAPVLEAGPFWFWAWAALLLSGLGTVAAAPGSWLAACALIFSPLFPALQLCGAIRYAGRDIAIPALVGFGFALGVMRAIATGTGHASLSAGLALATEPTAMFAAAFIVYRAATLEQGHWPHRLMPLALGAVGAVEAIGAVRGFFYGQEATLWPFWLAAAIPLATLQVIARMDTGQRTQGEIKAAQAARELADQRFRWLAAHTHDVVAEIGRDGRVVWVSESSRAYAGVDPADIVGRNAEEVARRYEIAPHTRPSPGPGAKPVEVRVQARSPEGEQRWLDTQLVAGPGLEQADGHFLVVARDVTDNVRAEHEIRASEARFRTFSLLGADYCFSADGELGSGVQNWITGRLEEISGYSHEELQQKGFDGFMHPDDIEAGRERVLRLIRAGGTSSHEFRLLTKSGETRFISERLLIERDGPRFRIYGAARDITEQRQLEQAVGRAQKLESLGLLAGGIAHDFNNLLMAIAGNAELGLESLAPDSASRPHLEAAIEAVEQAALLTEQLLAYAGRRSVTRAPVDLSERVHSVSILLGTGSTRGVDLLLDLDPELPTVLADPGGLQQLIMNLLLNAIEACDAGGQVRVSTRHPDGLDGTAGRWNVGHHETEIAYVSLEVTDNGAGMSAETLEHVFDPFFTTKAAGRGLGLAAAAGIVRSLGGGLQVESKPGDGTTFTVYLPASDRPARTKTKAPETAPRATGRVLVVDDDDRVRKVAAAMLRRLGYEVETAEDGPTAVRAFQDGHFDAVLLDAVMPGMSGAETFDALRAIRPDATVLMASGFDRESVVGDLLERGLAGFLAKPFRSDELSERMTALLEA
jgi:PAS domain S-box-containing protein